MNIFVHVSWFIHMSVNVNVFMVKLLGYCVCDYSISKECKHLLQCDEPKDASTNNVQKIVFIYIFSNGWY